MASSTTEGKILVIVINLGTGFQHPAMAIGAEFEQVLETTPFLWPGDLEALLNLRDDKSERTQATTTTTHRPSHADQPHDWLLPGI